MTDPASLQNLHPIVMPPEVSLWPPAPGWYVLALVALLIIARFTIGAVFRWKASWYRREGGRQLEALRRKIAGGDRDVLPEIPILLKAAALCAYPRERVAGLDGEPWRSFLNETANSELFSAEQGQLLQNVSCWPPALLQEISDEEIDRLLLSAKHWLQCHHVKVVGRGGGHD